MKNFVKLFGIIAIAAVIGFSFVSCGGGGGTPADNSVDGAGITITITDVPFTGKFAVGWALAILNDAGTEVVTYGPGWEEDGVVQNRKLSVKNDIGWYNPTAIYFYNEKQGEYLCRIPYYLEKEENITVSYSNFFKH